MASRIPTPKFKEVKPIVVRWKDFKRGLNTLVAPTKIRDDELSVATNVVLEGEGAPVRRPGVDYFGNASGNTGTYGLYSYYGATNNVHKVLKIEGGFLKVFNTSTEDWDIVSGGSFTSGIRTSGILSNDYLYLTNGVDPLSKYDGGRISVFSEISAPASDWVTRGQSLASGAYLYSYRITAVNDVGETLAAAAATVATIRRRDQWQINSSSPSSDYGVTVRWSRVTGASGYNVYGVNGGDETYIDHVDGQQVDNYIDYGLEQPSQFFPLPTGNSTGGVKGKYVLEFKGALIIGGDNTNPSRVHFSAGADKIDSFLISDGGGYIDISKNSSDGEVTGLAKYQNKIVAFKRRSSWQMDFTDAVVPSLVNIVNDIGCVSHYTIANVENDLYFLGRKIGGGAAIYVLGNEPNFLNVLRTNELSARVRPTLQAISPGNLDDAVAVYYDAKYQLFYNEGGDTKNNAAIIYDRERLGFTRYTGIYANLVTVYYDANEMEYLLFADGNDGRISEISADFTDDKGEPIVWNIKTKESDLDEPFLYKKYKWVNLRLKGVQGSIRIKIWTDSTETAYTASINVASPETAFGVWQFGEGQFGEVASNDEDTPDANIIRRIPISRQGSSAIARSLAVEIYGENVSDKATLLDVTIEARPKSKNFFPRAEVIT